MRTFTSVLVAFSLAAVPFGAQAAPVDLRVDPARSHISARTHGSTLFGAQGPEHAIEPSQWTLSLCMDLEHPAAPGASAELDIPVSSLEFDTDRARADAAAAGTVDPADVARLRSRMFEILDAEHHPKIRFSSNTIVHGSAARPVIKGDLTLRGVTVPAGLAMDITIAKDGSAHIVATSFTLTQSDFGIPVATVNGATEVSDGIDVTVDLWVTPTNKPCSPHASGSAGTGTAGTIGGNGGSPG
jgi:polyisoprenoid-binding protein YceI